MTKKKKTGGEPIRWPLIPPPELAEAVDEYIALKSGKYPGSKVVRNTVLIELIWDGLRANGIGVGA